MAPCILAHSLLLWSIPFPAFSYITSRHIFDCTNQFPTTQPATTHEHCQNKTRGLTKEFTPYGPKYKWKHAAQLLSLSQPRTIKHMNRHYIQNIIIIDLFKVCNIQHCNTTHMTVTTVNIIVNQQSFILYIAWRSHCATDKSRVKTGVFFSQEHVRSPWRWRRDTPKHAGETWYWYVINKLCAFSWCNWADIQHLPTFGMNIHLQLSGRPHHNLTFGALKISKYQTKFEMTVPKNRQWDLRFSEQTVDSNLPVRDAI